ncbi:hypothetical protein Tco_0982502, partial [Tanacetum coccineum]
RKEDIELAKKAGELMKEKIAAKLKEQWWLEEKTKATEALGRKKRNVEKAQIRASSSSKKAEKKEKFGDRKLVIGNMKMQSKVVQEKAKEQDNQLR